MTTSCSEKCCAPAPPIIGPSSYDSLGIGRGATDAEVGTAFKKVTKKQATEGGGSGLVGGKETAHRKHRSCAVINKLENAKTLKPHHVCAVCVKGSQHPVVGANCTKCSSARELT